MPVLEGVIVALLTPVDSGGQVDHGALRALTERLVARGVTGISPLGSTGEGFSLGLEQRLAVTDTVAGSVPAGMPVIPGVFAHNHEQAVAEIAAYAAHGATAVLAAPPAYYPLDAAEQLSYFSRLADETALPLVLYNIPVYTKIQIAPPAAAVLAAHPRVGRPQGLRQGPRTTPPHCSTRWPPPATTRRTSPSSPAPTRCSSPTCWPARAAPSARAPTSSPRRSSRPTRPSWQASSTTPSATRRNSAPSSRPSRPAPAPPRSSRRWPPSASSPAAPWSRPATRSPTTRPQG